MDRFRILMGWVSDLGFWWQVEAVAEVGYSGSWGLGLWWFRIRVTCI